MMKYRKPLLLAVLGLMALFYGGDWAIKNLLDEPLRLRREKTAKLQKELQDRRGELDKARKAGKELDLFKAESLPSSVEVARSGYQAWLLGLVEHVSLVNPNVDSSEPTAHRAPGQRQALYHQLSFSLRGRGTLEQLTRFLFEFYSTDLLHQIRSLAITPLEGTSQLELSISIDALVLPQAEQKDRLNTRRSVRLASHRLEDYQVLVQRNFFCVSDSADPTMFTYLTAVNRIDGQPEVWFTVRTNDEILRLHQGEVLEVGVFRGTVVEITDSDVVLESDGERWLLTVGENLTQAAALPPEF